ncbi:MAG: hypothetical protein ACYS0E_00570 [Planctomycetota bacterium]|jgi:hypothetical protein
MSIRDVFFPCEPRPLRGRRGIKIGLRAIHVVFAAGFLGAYIFGASHDARLPWAIGVAVSGGVFLLLDLHESAAFLLQVRGAVVLTKITLLAALPLLPGCESWVLGALLCLSVLSSHAPAAVRYRMLLGGETIRGSESSG